MNGNGRMRTESHPDQAVSPSPSDRARIARINGAIRNAARDLRARHRFLGNQDSIGASLLLASALGAASVAGAYGHHWLSGWVAVLAIAFFVSIAHEIEHDLIHQLYFRKRPIPHAAMMAVCWLLRPNTINPWIRRGLHLHHHKVSGTETDLEERAITNGEPFGPKRLLMMGDGVLAVLLRLGQAGNRRGLILAKFLAGYFPLGWVHFALWYGFLAVHAGRVFAPSFAPSWTASLDFVVTVWIVPNVLRSFCLNFMSSSMHYYGDVKPGAVLEQTQVLNAWRFLPLQLFCFNFGSTHAIHHFVANEPFYVRQWTARSAHRVLQAEGVPFNDLGTFRRANRRGTDFERAALAEPVAASSPAVGRA